MGRSSLIVLYVFLVAHCPVVQRPMAPTQCRAIEPTHRWTESLPRPAYPQTCEYWSCREFLSRIYKELKISNTKRKQIIQSINEQMNWTNLSEGQMANKYMKKCPVSSVIREIQIKLHRGSVSAQLDGYHQQNKEDTLERTWEGGLFHAAGGCVS